MGLILLIHRGRHFGRRTIWAVLKRQKEDFPVTLATFGQDSVDISGTKPGSNVGDGTGGAYTWFKDYNAGIVGKAEFMAHQTLYTGAINNTDGLSTLSAIYSGGWATDPTYLMKLQATYNSLGKQFQWLDQEAIQKYGNAPFKRANLSQIFPENRQSQTKNLVKILIALLLQIHPIKLQDKILPHH